jgi:diguanylate cyclase (GGDEF)-like protein/PAS domain S-box-containing protein
MKSKPRKARKKRAGKGGRRASRWPDMAAPVALDAARRAADDRLLSVIELSTEYYWETDGRHRFTRLLGRDQDTPDHLLGRTRWDIGGVPLEDGDWNGHQKVLDAHLPFRDFVYTLDDPEQGRIYLSISGKPVFDARGVFVGYRGITRDVTAELQGRALSKLENSITRLLAGADDISAALTSAMRAICESQGWEAGSFWKLDGQAGVMRYAGGWCTDTRPVLARLATQARTFTFAPGEGLPGWVLQTGDPLWVPDILRDPRVTDTSVTELTGWHSAFLFPIGTEAGISGVLDFYARHIREPDGRLLQLIHTLGREIGHFYRRALALEQLRGSEQLYATTFDLAEIGIAHVGLDGRFVHANRCLCRMFGYSRTELLSKTVREISHPEDVDVTNAERKRLHAGEIDTFRCEKRYLHKDGSVIWVSLTVASRRDSSGQCAYDISIMQDISASKETEERIRYLATHDALTGLPNRTLFSQLLGHAIESARRHERAFAILFIDLDGFKAVNDSLGHDAGDLLLKEVARRFRASVRSSDVVGRLGGDEFVVLVEEVSDPSQAAAIARKILEAGRQPVPVLGHDCRITASVGVCMFPADAGDEATMMKRADTAMYAAKSAGKNGLRFFSSSDMPG